MIHEAKIGLIIAAIGVLLGTAGSLGQDSQASGLEFVQKISVPADAGWVGTNLDVEEGQEYYFKARGEITLQKGNPMANCGPEGYDLKSIQQPVVDHNLGCLIGKVGQLISTRKDEETGEEVRDEIFRYFYIGAENWAVMPIKGRLYLGINENVVKDNSGEFVVEIYRKKPGSISG